MFSYSNKIQVKFILKFTKILTHSCIFLLIPVILVI